MEYLVRRIVKTLLRARMTLFLLWFDIFQNHQMAPMQIILCEVSQRVGTSTPPKPMSVQTKDGNF